jgi:hypothetical protein
MLSSRLHHHDETPKAHSHKRLASDDKVNVAANGVIEWLVNNKLADKRTAERLQSLIHR